MSKLSAIYDLLLSSKIKMASKDCALREGLYFVAVWQSRIANKELYEIAKGKSLENFEKQ